MFLKVFTVQQLTHCDDNEFQGAVLTNKLHVRSASFGFSVCFACFS